MAARYFGIVLFMAVGFWCVRPAGAQSAREQAPSRPGAEVNGQIQDSQGAPVAAALVQLRDASGGLIATEVTDAEGRFDLNVGGNGPFRIDVTDGGTMESANINAAPFENFVMRMPTAHVVPPSGASTISLNDLEAPKDAKSKLADAQKAMDARQLDKAWGLTNQAIAAAPNWGQAYLMRGVLNFENKNYGAAQADFTKAVQENPHNPAALTELGKLYSTTGAYKLSEMYLRQALKYPPVLWPTYYEYANLDMLRGQYAEAAAMAEDAEFATPPAPPSIHFVAGQANFKLQRWQKARLEFTQYIALAAKQPAAAAWTAKANAYLAKMPVSASAAAQPAAPAH